MVPCHSCYIYGSWGNGEKSHKGWGGGSIFMSTGDDPSRHLGLASLPELYLLILLFGPFFYLNQLGSSLLCFLE